MIQEIREQLNRLDAAQVEVTEDADFEPKAGRLICVAFSGAYWHLPPQQFLDVLSNLPAGAGAHAVHEAIERNGAAVWHGPAPEQSRDTPL